MDVVYSLHTVEPTGDLQASVKWPDVFSCSNPAAAGLYLHKNMPRIDLPRC